MDPARNSMSAYSECQTVNRNSTGCRITWRGLVWNSKYRSWFGRSTDCYFGTSSTPAQRSASSLFANARMLVARSF